MPTLSLRHRRVTADELSLAFYLATEPLWNPQCLGLHQIIWFEALVAEPAICTRSPEPSICQEDA